MSSQLNPLLDSEKKSLRFVADQCKAVNNHRKDVVDTFHTTEKFNAW